MLFVKSFGNCRYLYFYKKDKNHQLLKFDFCLLFFVWRSPLVNVTMHLTPHNSYSRVEWKKVRITARSELWEVAIISKFWLQNSFRISVSAEEGMQGTGIWKQLHNNLQTNNFLNLLINQFSWKNLWYSTVFLFSVLPYQRNGWLLWPTS